MKLAAVYFDDTVCIPGGKDVGGGARRQDLRESTFHVDDGWSITLLAGPSGVEFSIFREGMPSSVMVGGYGYTYTPAASGKALIAYEDAERGVISEATLGNTELSAAKLLGKRRRK